MRGHLIAKGLAWLGGAAFILLLLSASGVLGLLSAGAGSGRGGTPLADPTSQAIHEEYVRDLRIQDAGEVRRCGSEHSPVLQASCLQICRCWRASGLHTLFRPVTQRHNKCWRLRATGPAGGAVRRRLRGVLAGHRRREAGPFVRWHPRYVAAALWRPVARTGVWHCRCACDCYPGNPHAAYMTHAACCMYVLPVLPAEGLAAIQGSVLGAPLTVLCGTVTSLCCARRCRHTGQPAAVAAAQRRHAAAAAAGAAAACRRR